MIKPSFKLSTHIDISETEKRKILSRIKKLSERYDKNEQSFKRLLNDYYSKKTAINSELKQLTEQIKTSKKQITSICELKFKGKTCAYSNIIFNVNEPEWHFIELMKNNIAN